MLRTKTTQYPDKIGFFKRNGARLLVAGTVFIAGCGVNKLDEYYLIEMLLNRVSTIEAQCKRRAIEECIDCMHHEVEAQIQKTTDTQMSSQLSEEIRVYSSYLCSETLYPQQRGNGGFKIGDLDVDHLSDTCEERVRFVCVMCAESRLSMDADYVKMMGGDPRIIKSIQNRIDWGMCNSSTAQDEDTIKTQIQVHNAEIKERAIWTSILLGSVTITALLFFRLRRRFRPPTENEPEAAPIEIPTVSETQADDTQEKRFRMLDI
jgi:hypothetical protein